MKGIEPSYSAWKAAALPLSYTRNNSSSRDFAGFQPQQHTQKRPLPNAFAIRTMGGVGFEPT